MEHVEQAKIVARYRGVKVPQLGFLGPRQVWRLKNHKYEAPEVEGALSVINSGDRVIELGAGLGIVGAVVAFNRSPEQILSFEANPDLIAPIRELYRLNKIEKKISVRNEILISSPDIPKSETFFRRGCFLGSSMSSKESSKERPVDVPCASFEKVKKAINPTALMMDIEGAELEFLRHADLSGIDKVIVEFHPDVYGEKGLRDCQRILTKNGFKVVKDVSTDLVWTCTRGLALSEKSLLRTRTDLGLSEKRPEPSGGWSCSIVDIADAILVPPKVNEWFDVPAGVLYPDGRYCHEAALWRGARHVTIPPEYPSEPLERLDGTWVWGGLLFGQFGHFLMESTARLWALELIGEKVDGILFAPKDPNKGPKRPAFQDEFLKLLSIDLPIQLATEATSVERLLVPGQAFGLADMIAGTQAFRKTITDRLGADIAPDGPEKLYISRTEQGKNKGGLVHEERLVSYLSEHGYIPFAPEQASLNTQIARYKAAKRVISADGSALHLFSMVATSKQRLGIVLRRRLKGPPRNIVRQFKAFTGKNADCFETLSRVWTPRGKRSTALHLGELDMPELQRQLVKKRYIKPNGKEWVSSNPAEVEEMLGSDFDTLE